jgi:acyl dehydratase
VTTVGHQGPTTLEEQVPTTLEEQIPTTWEELQVGAAAPPLIIPPLKVQDFVRYQGASGDLNPIHYDTVFAQAAGYPGPFAVGMFAAGVLGTYVTDWLGPRNVRRFGVRFSQQAWPGDVLTFRGQVKERRETEGQRYVELDLQCLRQTGDVHLSGTATFLIP